MERYKPKKSRPTDLFGTNWNELSERGSKPAKKGFRVNTLKGNLYDISSRFDCEPLPWCKWGFRSSEDIGTSIEHFQGLIYVQEAASMAAAMELDPKPGEDILDLCAAPGSKTCQMAQMMKNTGCIIANEPEPKRIRTLRFNLNRMGIINTIITQNDGRDLPEDAKFDKVLLDAPCSNLGQGKREPSVLAQWTPQLTKRRQKLQIALLESGYRALKEGGTMIYSTCTLTVAENETVVDRAIKDLGMQACEITSPIKSSPVAVGIGKIEFDEGVRFSKRILPKDNDTDGFFMAKLKK